MAETDEGGRGKKIGSARRIFFFFLRRLRRLRRFPVLAATDGGCAGYLLPIWGLVMQPVVECFVSLSLSLSLSLSFSFFFLYFLV